METNLRSLDIAIIKFLAKWRQYLRNKKGRQPIPRIEPFFAFGVSIHNATNLARAATTKRTFGRYLKDDERFLQVLLVLTRERRM